MKKTPSLFKRDYAVTRKVYDEVVEGSEWVIAGEGVATRKWDGTCCLVKDGKLFKRYDRKLTKEANKRLRDKETGQLTASPVFEDFKPAPEGWEPAEETPNAHTGHWPGWVLVTADDPSSKWHWAAWEAWHDGRQSSLGHPSIVPDGTYELCGPHFQGNPEGFEEDVFIPHGVDVVHAPRTFDELRDFLGARPHMEGIVWHHDDGRMVKIKRGDFVENCE